MSEKPTKDYVIRDLIEFFLEEFSRDGMGVCDWVAQGDWDVDEFIAAVRKLKRELALRDADLPTANDVRGILSDPR